LGGYIPCKLKTKMYGKKNKERKGRWYNKGKPTPMAASKVPLEVRAAHKGEGDGEITPMPVSGNVPGAGVTQGKGEKKDLSSVVEVVHNSIGAVNAAVRPYTSP